MPTPAAAPLRALFLSSLLLAAACAMGPQVETTVYERPDGVLVVDTVQLEATVVAIDATRREVRLKPRGGKEETFKAGPEVVNFQQIRVGDVVRAVVVEALAVTLVPGGEPESVGTGAAVALAPQGAKPGVVMADTIEVTGTVTAIDGHEHTLTVQFPDGTFETIRVAKHRDLSKVALGDSLRMQLTKGVAISVEKP